MLRSAEEMAQAQFDRIVSDQIEDIALHDIAHAPADHSNRRHSPKDYAVWEIHPVMKLDVVQ